MEAPPSPTPGCHPVYVEAQSVLEALSLDMLLGRDPEPSLARGTLAEQRLVTAAAVLVLRSVVLDLVAATQVCVGCTLEDLGLRIARRAVGLAAS